MIQGSELKRLNRSTRTSPAERILMTVFLWTAVVGLAALLIIYLPTAHP